jgi:cellulose synthase (UDP-forming)
LSILTKLKKPILVFASLALVVYLTWRIIFTFPVEWVTPVSWVVAGLVLLIELAGALESLLFYLNSANSKSPVIPEGDTAQFPDVDIFITTYNEPLELVSQTVRAAKALEYPDTSKVHIYLCDDGNRKDFANFAKDEKINYLFRRKREGAKAGNLNNALKKSKSELIANFDADMAPYPEFLMKTVPFFYPQVSDIDPETLGFVQTPQNFRTLDLFQKYFLSKRMKNEQDFFYQSIELSKNKSNSVVYGGSNTLLSRKALNKVQGFNTETLTEDFATGMLIEAAGFRGLAINEKLAAGLTPTTLQSLVNQRKRWTRGCLEVF